MVKPLVLLLAASPLATAFPAISDWDAEIRGTEALTHKTALELSKKECNSGIVCSKNFDAKKQFVDISPGSGHEWKAPGKGDRRGECPGLNAASNHNFLPRDGLTTITETITGLHKMVNMAIDLSGFLAAVSVALSGDFLTETWSIGGGFKSSAPGILAHPQGLAGTHNKYEGDASFSRFDAYLNDGDSGTLRMPAFKQFYKMALKGEVNEFTFDIMRQHNKYSADYSLHNNPYYFSAPFAGLVTPAAHEFIMNFMSNHSESHPSGYLNRHILKDWFSITGEYPDLKWTDGHERIPRNWYKRPANNAYSAQKNVADTVITGLAYPGTVRIGGNLGKVNSFEGVDIGDLTGGTFTNENLFKGNNLGCFFVQAATAGLSDQLLGLVADSKPVIKLVEKFASPITDKLNCPALAKYDVELFKKYPGYSHPKRHGNS